MINKNIRWKIIIVFLTSIVIAVVGVFLLLMIASFVSGYSLPGMILTRLYNTVGPYVVAIITGIILFTISFFILTQRSIRYLEEINIALKNISQGNLETRVNIKSRDELGELAQNINLMAEQLKQLIEEERNAEKTKNELVTSVSHDLRTPLTSILGYLGLIVNDKYKDELVLRYYIDIAYNKAQTLKKLIDELFEFTKISYGGIKVNLDRINIVELLEQLAEEFVPILDENGMEYRLTLPENKIYVKADGGLLVRVFENLLSNAITYGKEGKYVDIQLENENNETIVSIINYGETIPEMDLKYIFDRFYRVEKSRSQDTGGTGLGLSIAKNIVELHEGKITAFSQNGKTMFQVKLKSLLEE
ncbi:sensor histidine kinase [Gottschalkia purinilytica]|uniref:sensor histidine kinase n=1 Tax=Gottschalkia purinilytica TaxID=1503 RepID=UPI0019102016|nr:HAMP domain-containing sensor histidine kinase [Gottschalkia purinilytica]